MSNKKDLTGQRFNNLIVITEVLNRPPAPRFQRSCCWLCKCLKCDGFSIGITNDLIIGRHKCECQKQIKCKQCGNSFIRRSKGKGQIRYCSKKCADLSIKKKSLFYSANCRSKLTLEQKQEKYIWDCNWRLKNRERILELKIKYHHESQRKKQIQKLLSLSNVLSKGETHDRTTHDH
jgi:hypothetical protein